jgi:hypothetical protein
MNLNSNFPKYNEYSPQVPIWCVTPESKGCMHRFFDTCPVSPSGRFLAVMKMPFEDRLAKPGEPAAIIIVDLETGVEKQVDETRGWGPQLGTNINWGENDNILLYSDVDTTTWKSHCVKLNLKTGERRTFGKGVYHVSPDGKKILCTNPAAMNRTQIGYGVGVPAKYIDRNIGLRDDDGLYITDVDTGECKLLISIKEAVERTVIHDKIAEYDKYENYFFHSKFNLQGDRLIFTLRRFPIAQPRRFNTLHGDNLLKFDVFTMKPDGSELYNAVPAECWEKGGHHINFFPDGKRLSMNLAFKDDEVMRFTQVNYDGSDMKMIIEEPIGSGHPSIHPNGKILITDSYIWEPVAFGDGTVPLRLINLESKEETTVCRMLTETHVQAKNSLLQIDPHPTWDRDFKHVIFNGFADGTRKVYIADMSSFI